jgi:hypothetical protein
VKGFEDLPLHDATLKSVHYNWDDSMVSLTLSIYALELNSSTPFQLTFEGCSDLHIPHLSKWGESSSVNTFVTENESYQLEMQSGDVIALKAKGFSFVPIAL